MIQLILRPAAIAILLLAGESPAAAHSTNSEVSVVRSFSADTASPGDTVEVVITAEFGSIGSDPVRGFFLSDHIPAGLSPSSGVVTLDGSAVAAVLETGEEGAMYAGCTAARWVMETPPAWSEGHPIFASSTLVVAYEVTVPPDAENGELAFPGFSWVGMIDAQGSAGDHFGYEDSPATITVQGGVEPDDPDPDDPDADAGSNGNAATDNRSLTGGCAVGRGAPGMVVLLLAFAALSFRRRPRCRTDRVARS